MTVSVLFFGHYADLFRGESLPVTLADGTTLGSLVTHLETENPRLVGIARHCRFAVQEEYAGSETVLGDGNVVAVLPPMSGG